MTTVGVENSTVQSLPPRTRKIMRVLRSQLPELQQRYGVKYLGVFGSYIRGDYKPKSDLDILVEFDYPPTLFQFIAIEQQLSKLTGVEVDLVMKKVLKPDIGRQILTEVIAV